MQAIGNKILKRIRAKGRGWVFTPKDFLDLGSRAAVDQALSRFARTATIRRLGHGLYDYPRTSPRFGQLSPSLDAVAKAIARKSGSRLQIGGAQAANALGLSTQVPAKLIYLTDGPTRRVDVGRQTIFLRHASPRKLVGAGTPSGLALQALRYLGRDRVDETVISRLGRQLSRRDKDALRRDATYAADWLRPIATRIAETL